MKALSYLVVRMISAHSIPLSGMYNGLVTWLSVVEHHLLVYCFQAVDVACPHSMLQLHVNPFQQSTTASLHMMPFLRICRQAKR